ncbi:MAG: hypothetical protein KGI50_00685 [Patescibacteria group bacterium]|nr:hypothetical protein [Patescibacteria group bacterium]MDE2438130.1 hypothetical protein [Patescibacteria group bacterium]
MKNIATILNRGNLTPREKFLLLIHNDIQRTKTGKDILTEADKAALENWKAKTSEEVREWNQLNEGWKYCGRMEIEAELAYKDAQAVHLSQLPIILNLLFYPADRRAGFCIDNLKRIKKVTIEEAVEITRKQKEVKLKEGMDFDYAVYQLAFELLDLEDRKRLNELYADVEFDHQYLDQEEIIAHLYGGKKELNDAAKKMLADLVAEQSYNKFAKEYQLFHYFACIPLLEVARYFLKSHGVVITGDPLAKDQEAREEDDDIHDAVTKAMQHYAKEHTMTIKAMLREACRRWLDDGLIEEYTPLAASDDAELLKRWFQSKVKARKTLRKHVASGELALRERTEEETRKEKLWSKGLYDSEFASAAMIFENLNIEPSLKGELDEKRAFETFNNTVITGTSLYAFGGAYAFVKDFKKRVDTYDPNLGLVYAENDPDHTDEHLDQELLICSLAGNREPGAFSRYGMSVTMLSNLLYAQTLFEEFRKNGTLFLRFKDEEIAKIFAERRQLLINGYAILLGFETVFKKLSPIYETDMAEHVSERLAALRENMEQLNKAIRTATNIDEESNTTKNRLFHEKETMPFEEDVTIDIATVEPDQKTIEEHEAKVRAIFPEL